MRKTLLIPLFAVLIGGSCTQQRDEYKEASELITPEKEENKIMSASLIPDLQENILSKRVNSLKAGNSQEIDNLKKMPLQSIFNKNMPFTANKGQLEKWHNIKIEKIGDIKFYTTAFGGTAYFGKNGIGIGFSLNHLDVIHAKKFSRADHPKKGKSLFFYIDHEGSNEDALMEGWNERETKLNYFKGEESEFITDISNYDGVVYKGLYKNIDLKYSLNEGNLIYDYIIQPGGNVSDIKRNFSDVKKIRVNAAGELEVHTEWGILTDKKLYAYQLVDGKEVEVKVRYKKLSEKSAGFEVIGKYDRSKDLIIDPPTLTFGTWATPGGHDGYIHDLTVDATGNIYACGWINGSEGATLVTPFDNVPAGGDAVVFKLNSTGTTMIYASYIGGDGNGGTNEVAFGVAVNSSNQAYVAGFTDNATGFPTAGSPQAPLRTTIAGSKDIFVLKINAAGSGLIYSTLYGDTGDDRAFGIAVNSSDEAFITGWTTSTANFASAGAYKTTKSVGGAFGYEAFVLKISDPTAGTVVRNYCTYFGGTNEDMGRAIAVNGADVFITGVSQSSDLPRTVGATFGGGGGGGAFDAYIARINGATGNNLVYCTYVGGDFDEKAEGIDVTSANEAYITGWTRSIVRAASGPGSFPIVNAIAGYTQNATVGGNVRDVFMTRVNATGTIVNSTFMGALGDDNVKNGNPFDGTVQHRGSDVSVNAAGNVAVVMATDGGAGNGGATLPTISSVDGTPNGGSVGLGDAYIFVLNSDAQTLSFTTYYGGSDNDYPTAGIEWDPSNPACLIIGGGAHSATLPTTAGVYSTARKGGTGPDEGYIAKYCEVVLPVELTTFTAHLAGQGKVLVEWVTSMEKDNDHFEVQRSADGKNFTTIGVVKGTGNSTESISYFFWDEEPLGGNSYYRLRQVDFDGTASLSKIAVVTISVLNNVKIYPNPSDEVITISNVFDASSDIEIKIINALGQELLTVQETVIEGVYEKVLDISQFDEGMYIIQIQTETESKTEKLVKK